MAKMQVFTIDNLSLYDELLKGYVDAGDAKSLKTVAIEGNTLKFYRVSEPVGDTAPAYTITLPETDLSGLIPKITGATAGNVVTAKADGTVQDSGVAVSDLATKAEVKAVDDKAVANANAIAAHKELVDAKVTTLIGDDTNKSVRTIANEELAAQLIPEGAKESLNTLQEIASWIQSHPDDASAMNQAITALQTLVGTIPEGATATDIVNYIKELVDAEKTRATGVESGLNTRLTAVEALVGEGGSVDEKIATAKQEAIDAAAADATTKANTAETNAKAHATELNTAMDTRVSSLETKVGDGFEAIPESAIRALFA